MADLPRVRVLFCDACGAPLDARAFDALVLCRYCSATNAVGAPLAGQLPDDGRPRVNLGGRTYVVEGLLGHGDASDVFRGRWAMRLGELVVLKVNRARPDLDLLRQEWATLEHLHRAHDPSSAALAARLPQPIAFGPSKWGQGSANRVGAERWVAAYGWHSGFVHSLEDVRAAHPGGVDGQVAVWLFRRLLELLGFVHRAGVVHGAVLPPHVLVHPRDHGAMLVGWGCAQRRGAASVRATSRAWSSWYAGPWARPERSAALDIAFAARCAAEIASGLAEPVAALVASAQAGALGDDAWLVADRLKEASRAAYGPPGYHPLPMPGWNNRDNQRR